MKRDSHSRADKSQPRRRKWVPLSWLVAAVVVCLIVLVAWFYSELQPPAPGGRVSVTVHAGESAGEVASTLEQKGLVKSAFWFRQYLNWTGYGRKIQAGQYDIRRGDTEAQIARQLAVGLVADNSIRMTVPEGFTVLQIASRLNDLHICSTQAFLHAEQHDVFSQSFLASLPRNPHIKYRLEGYLFPDTYDFYPGESPDLVINGMLNDFSQHVTPSMIATARSEGMSLSQWVTKASLIEREAKVNDERPIIASVINNRLRDGMKLQIDATIEYILGYTPVVTDADTRIPDPYNTYMNNGLPPGPIANPGMASLTGALHPAHTNYLYYVVKNDGTGRDYFATTYAEQLNNIGRSQANLRNRSGRSS